jgi:hypothetical protein
MIKKIILSDEQSYKHIEANPFGKNITITIKNNADNESMFIILDTSDAYELIEIIKEAIDHTSDE